MFFCLFRETRNDYESHLWTTTTEQQSPDIGQVHTSAVGLNVLTAIIKYILLVWSFVSESLNNKSYLTAVTVLLKTVYIFLKRQT